MEVCQWLYMIEITFCLNCFDFLADFFFHFTLRSDQISRSVVSDSLRPHESQSLVKHKFCGFCLFVAFCLFNGAL